MSGLGQEYKPFGNTKFVDKNPKWISRNKYLSSGSIGPVKKKIKKQEKKKEKSSFTCNLCDKSYESNYSLKVHIRSHTGEKPFTCSMCLKSFTTSYQLERHSFCHNKTSSFICNVCDKSFASKDLLTIHLRSHSGELPFACDKCDRKYPSKNGLNRHRLIHEGQKGFLCDECGKTFMSNSTLKIHAKSHVIERRFPCDFPCRLRFKRKMDLDRHKKTHQEIQQRLPCPLCSPQCFFRRKDNLTRHLRLTHNQTKEEPNGSFNSLNCNWKEPLEISSLPDSELDEIEEMSIQRNIFQTNDNAELEEVEIKHIVNLCCDEKDISFKEQKANRFSQNYQISYQYPSNCETDKVLQNESEYRPIESQEYRINPPTNQRSVIRSVESLEFKKNIEKLLVPSQPQENYEIQSEIIDKPSEYLTNQIEPKEFFSQQSMPLVREDFYQRERIFDPYSNYQNDQSEFEHSSNSRSSLTPPNSSATITQSFKGYYTEFRYGTLFPFKPHIFPIDRNFCNDNQKYVVVNHQKPTVSSDNLTLLDLTSSSREVFSSSYDIPELRQNHPIENDRNLSISSTLPYSSFIQSPNQFLNETRRPENFSVIRRASPNFNRMTETIPHSSFVQDINLTEDSKVSSNQNANITMISNEVPSQAVCNYSMPQEQKDEATNNKNEGRLSQISVNPHAIRDPRKNFLRENFKRHYQS